MRVLHAHGWALIASCFIERLLADGCLHAVSLGIFIIWIPCCLVAESLASHGSSGIDREVLLPAAPREEEPGGEMG